MQLQAAIIFEMGANVPLTWTQALALKSQFCHDPQSRRRKLLHQYWSNNIASRVYERLVNVNKNAKRLKIVP
jgi:hypothetical protein